MKSVGKNSVVNRRIFLFAAATVASGAIAWGLLPDPGFAAETLTPPEAHQKAKSGELLLIDIRRPDEWAKTGSGQHAVRLDMRRSDFIEALDQLVKGDRTRAIAVICARGVRSQRMRRRLHDAGFVNVIDVPEGMLGSRAGPGWLKRGLPTRS